MSRYFVDHYLLNFVLTDWAMLHASCVLSPDVGHLIIMIAAHNTGKSTTAFHLLPEAFVFPDGLMPGASTVFGNEPQPIPLRQPDTHA